MTKDTNQKITWNDIQSATQQELKKTYKLSDRQLEQQVRYHLDGATTQDRRNEYQKIYGRKK